MKTNNTKRTFVIDDDPFWTAILTQLLTDLGYTNITTFSSGNQCFKYLYLNPDLVFLDYQMDDMDGLEVLQQIKRYNSDINVVFCTAHQDLSVAVDAFRFGSVDYLLKENANRRELAALVSKVVN